MKISKRKQMNKIRCAVIGVGKVADYHAQAYKDCPDAELAACWGRNIEKAEKFGEKYGIAAYDDLAKMVKEQGIQAASICVPHPNHGDLAVALCNLGVSIAIEKPLAASLEDCDAIIEAAERNHVKGTTICQRRFYRPCMRIKKAITDGKIGKPIIGTVNMFGWRDMNYYHADPWRGTWKGEGGGVLINQAPHQLDLLLWYMGEIDEVYAIWDTLNHPQLEVDDTAAAIIRFKNGSIGNVLVTNSVNPALYGKVRVYGSNGAAVGVKTDGGEMFIAGMSKITEPPVNDCWTVGGEAQKLDEYVNGDTEAFNAVDNSYFYFTEQICDFINAIINDTDPLITLRDGRNTVELITAIYRSNRDKKPVKFPLAPEYGDDYDGRLIRKISPEKAD